MQYFVHIYATCRRKVPIEAESQEEAVLKASVMNMEKLFNTHGRESDGETYPEYSDEVIDFLVDEAGDQDYARSTVWKLNSKGEPIIGRRR
jgi:CRISPR/Cas system CSM-associated protein Csm2 small subunit